MAEATADERTDDVDVGELVDSMVGFALAVFTSIREHSWKRLWLPLSLLPALVALPVLALIGPIG